MFTQGVINDRIIVFKKNNEISSFFLYRILSLIYLYTLPIT